MKSLNRLATAGTLAVTLLGCAAPSAAQMLTGEIHGRVTDVSGAVLPGVSVTVTGAALIRPELAVTSETGTFSFPRLPIGSYDVRFELTGFRQVLQQGVRIETGFSAEINP